MTEHTDNIPVSSHKPSLAQAQEGATAIEFAIVAPVFFLMMMGIVEFGLILFANNVIENASTVGARLGITGNDYADESRVAKPETGPQDRVSVIRENISRRAGGLLDDSKLSISCEALDSGFGALASNSTGNHTCGGAIDNTQSCSNIGTGGQAVVYTVSYCWDLFTPLIGAFFSNNQLLLQSSLVVKNEDFVPNPNPNPNPIP